MNQIIIDRVYFLYYLTYFNHFLILVISHSIPSYNPSFSKAEHATIDHYLSLISSRFNVELISSADKDIIRSYLFA